MRGEHAPASISKMTIMKIKHMIAVSLLLLTGIRTANAVEWQMKQGPMMTPWSETLDPENVLGEYPRPQMERQEWMNLNGIWDLRKAIQDEAYSPDFIYDKKILVPFPLESAISGVMEESDNQCYWYRRTEREKHPVAFRCRGLESDCLCQWKKSRPTHGRLRPVLFRHNLCTNRRRRAGNSRLYP